MSKANQVDVAIVGSGPAGHVAALQMARLGLSTILIGPAHSGADGRTTALLGSSMSQLERLGVWNDVTIHGQALRVMRLIDDTGRLFRAPTTEFDSSEIGLDAFGYNIGNNKLVDVLQDRFHADGSGLLERDQQFARSVALKDDVAEVTMEDGTVWRARLAIAADGRNSRVRQAAGIDMRRWSYPQAALVVNLRHSASAHNNVSTEFHTKTGPFTLVPYEDQRTSSLVCVVTPEVAEALKAMDSSALSLELERRAPRCLSTSPEADCDSLLDFRAKDFAVEFLEPSDDANVLGRLGGIDIHSVIGQGGNGIVLKGFQEELNRLVAVKVMAPQLAANAAARKRFSREAQATAAIVHPNVMPILTVNATRQLPFLVMPYVDCESLQDRIDREAALPVIDVLRIGLQVARGLAAAHAQGLVHRDVKPANILLERGVDRVMLTDFGLARAVDDATLTRTGLIAGTPQYMSPEQARGESVDSRSDLFSLGSVLYAACTGRPPFRAETSLGILRRVSDSQQRSVGELNSDVPAWLEAIINRLMTKDASTRFESAEQVAELLEDCIAHVQQPSVNSLPASVIQLVSTELSQQSRWLIVRNWIVAVAATVAVALIAAVLSNPGQPNSEDSEITTSGTVGQSGTESEEIAVPQSEDSTEPASTELGSDGISTSWDDNIVGDLEQLDMQVNDLLQTIEAEWD